MGSPISPVLAELVMEYLEEIIFETLSREHISIFFYCRYVDDCFLIFNPRFLKDILKKFNSFHPRLQFTYEEET